MADTVPINVATCKLNGFWQQEILSKKTKPQYQCCSLFTNDEAELPMFCPPTAGWCKYQSNGGPEWSKVKKLCCNSFGNDLGSACPSPPSPQVKAHQTPKQKAGNTANNGTPMLSISQAIAANIPLFNVTMDKNNFKKELHIEKVSANDHYFINDSTENAITCLGDCSQLILII